MLFCQKCGSLLRLKEKSGKKVMWCSCGYSSNLDKQKVPTFEKEAKGKEESRRIAIIEEIETNPLIEATCEKCGNKQAYYWTQQTRAADEPETRFFKCTKCNYTWREYA